MKEEFERYRFTSYTDIFVSFNKYGMTFSASSIKLMEYAKFVEVYLDRNKKRFAITPGKEGDPDVRAFVQDSPSRNVRFVRWSERHLLHELIDLGEIDLGEKGVRIPGEYVESDKMIVYDLTRSEAIRGRKKR